MWPLTLGVNCSALLEIPFLHHTVDFKLLCQLLIHSQTCTFLSPQQLLAIWSSALRPYSWRASPPICLWICLSWVFGKNELCPTSVNRWTFGAFEVFAPLPPSSPPLFWLFQYWAQDLGSHTCSKGTVHQLLSCTPSAIMLIHGLTKLFRLALNSLGCLVRLWNCDSYASSLNIADIIIVSTLKRNVFILYNCVYVCMCISWPACEVRRNLWESVLFPLVEVGVRWCLILYGVLHKIWAMNFRLISLISTS